jgi:hypothetical protein
MCSGRKTLGNRTTVGRGKIGRENMTTAGLGL